MRRTSTLAIVLLLGCGQKPPDPETLVRQLREGTQEQRDAAVAKLTELGDQVAPLIPEIEKAVLDEDPQVRRAAVKTLAAMGTDAKDGLIVALGDAEADIREQAATALGDLGVQAKQTIPHLAQRLSDDDYKVAAAARRGLVNMGDAARPALARIVVKGEDLARDNALRALVEIGDASIPDLLEAAKSHNANVRRAVLESLIMMKAPPTVVLEAYRRALSDRDGTVRDVAARAIQGLGEAAAEAAPDLVPLLADDDNAGPAQWALQKIGPEAVPTLTEALGHTDPVIRSRAAQTLGQMPKDAAAATDALVAALSDEQASVRREAVAALAALGPPESAVEPLRACLSDDDEQVVHRAKQALARAAEK